MATTTKQVVLSKDEALKFLTEAWESLDQAHSCMIDAGIDGYACGTWPQGFTIKKLVANVGSLIDEVKTAECSECGLALHDGPCPEEEVL
jgi:hypothetical protein